MGLPTGNPVCFYLIPGWVPMSGFLSVSVWHCSRTALVRPSHANETLPDHAARLALVKARRAGLLAGGVSFGVAQEAP
jgi:hypothetical protein